MTLKPLTLGERIVMAARMAAADHLRQEADEQGLNVKQLQNQMAVVRMNEVRMNEVPTRSNPHRSPTPGDDDKEAA